mmetsp:Transcript_29991/g.71345  ORF Transcript_29991/g.71345 Transcript_29991/m.71345 type:complete len:223 (-) Transcript_29991:1121-1789(-)
MSRPLPGTRVRETFRSRKYAKGGCSFRKLKFTISSSRTGASKMRRAFPGFSASAGGFRRLASLRAFSRASARIRASARSHFGSEVSVSSIAARHSSSCGSPSTSTKMGCKGRAGAGVSSDVATDEPASIWTQARHRSGAKLWPKEFVFVSTAPATLICGSSEEGDSRASSPPRAREVCANCSTSSSAPGHVASQCTKRSQGCLYRSRSGYLLEFSWDSQHVS